MLEPTDNDVLEISLELESRNGICGLLATMEYDESALALVSCGVGESNEDKLTFSYKTSQGRIVFLMDGQKNSAPCGALAKFYFKISNDISAPKNAEIRLLPIAERCSFFIDEIGAFQEISLDTRDSTVCIDKAEPENKDVIIPPRLCSLTARGADGEFWLDLVGERIGNKHFAIGFKVFAVDTHSAQTTTVIVAKVVNGEKTDLSIALPHENGTCVIITPLAYNGKKIIEGEKQIFLFE